ncbi:MAG: spore germination protein [Clostridiales bacterium]|nr:spore germination protein [Clostridiales bacterium]
MKERSDRLSNIQILFIVSSTIIGVTVLTLPRTATELAKAGGFIATFITGVLMALMLIITALLARRFPNYTIMEYSKEIIGLVPAKILGFVFFCYFISVGATILRLFCDAIKVLLLENTPLEVLIITFLLAAVYLCLNGISSIAKICELFEPLVIGTMLLVIVLSLKNFNFEELLPAFKQDIFEWLHAVPTLAISYLGFEVLLFITPYVQDASKVVKYGFCGILPSIFIYSLFVAVTVGIAGVEPVARSLYPTIQLARYIKFPGGFAERFDIFFMIFWILGAYTTVSSFLYLSSVSITRLLGLRNYKPFILLIVPVIYMLALFPQNIKEISMFSQYASYLGLALLAVVVVLYILAVILKKGEIFKNDNK